MGERLKKTFSPLSAKTGAFAECIDEDQTSQNLNILGDKKKKKTSRTLRVNKILCIQHTNFPLGMDQETHNLS